MTSRRRFGPPAARRRFTTRAWFAAALIICAALTATSAWAAAMTVTSANLTAQSQDSPTFYPISMSTTAGTYACGLVLENTCGTTGAPNKNDRVTVSFSGVLIDQSTMCPEWTPSNTTDRSLTDAKVTITDGVSPTNDTLTVSSVSCTGGIRFGTVDLGSPGYVSATRTYTDSTFALTGTGTTPPAPVVTITLGTASGSSSVPTSPGHMFVTCHSSLQSTAAATCGTNVAKSDTTTNF